MTESDREGPANRGAVTGSSLPEDDGPEDDGPEDDGPEDDWVDVSLIRWMLSLTHKQRLLVLQQSVNSIIKLRNAKRTS